MDRRNDRRFWSVFILFCIGLIAAGELFGIIDLSTMTRAEQVIYTAAMVLCGIVMRYWFRNSPDEVKKIFKS